MNKYKRCKRCRDKKTMPAPDFPKIGKFVYFSPPRHGKTEKVINISNYYKISDENYNYVLYIGDELLKNCLKVERLKSYFARNIFGIGRNSLKNIPFIERIKLILKVNPINLSYRVGMGIHDTNSIKIWLNELQRMIPYIHKIFLIFKLLIPLMQTKQDMERGGESRN